MEYRNIIGEDLILIKNFLKDEEIKEYKDLIDKHIEFEEISQALPGTKYPHGGKFRRLFAVCGSMEFEGNVKVEPVPDPIEVIRTRVQEVTEEEYNGIFFNKYRNGGDGFGLHTDTAVPGVSAKYFPILSIGGPREFHVFHPKKGKKSMTLDSGDLLLPSVDGFHKKQWLHGLLQTTKKVNPRISVVFYNVKKEDM